MTPTSRPAEHTLPEMTLTGDEPLFIVLNTGSGRHAAGEVEQTIRDVLGNAGRQFELMPVNSGRQLPSTAQRAVARARAEQGVVVAAGGDGTLNAVSQAVLGSGLPFGILPQGTFNYFGRTYGISQDTGTALACLLDAVIQPVPVGLLNEHVFLVNASLGLYPTLLEDREAWKQRFGRSRLVALWAALATLMRAHRQLDLVLDYTEGQQRVRTPTLVVGNNALQLEHIGIDHLDDIAQGRLVAMTARELGTLDLYGLLLRGLLSSMGEAENVITFGFDSMTVRFGRRRRIKVAMDGEIIWLRTPLVFRVAPDRLPLLVPRDPALRERV
ncbi:diacylglycerol/lipid kinase family protein [Isoalcanivorax pacificus]|nr:diacylglycerol kinase family protein [Isoalcanivorax pacificus]